MVAFLSAPAFLKKAGAASTATLFSQKQYTAADIVSGLANVNTGCDFSGGGLAITQLVSAPLGSITASAGWWDTARGDQKYLTQSSTTTEQTSSGTDGVDFAGGDLLKIGGENVCGNFLAEPSGAYRALCFAEYAGYYKTVLFSGNGTTQSIAHGLGSTPGMIIIKRRNTAAQNWPVWHRSMTAGGYMLANTTGLRITTTAANFFGNNTITVDPDASTFTVGSNAAVNTSGGSYVAFCFGHDTGPTGLIQCGAYTGNNSASGPTVSLGWDPQFLLIKNASATGNWISVFNILAANETYRSLNNNDGGVTSSDIADPTGTGFQIVQSGATFNASGNSYVYLAVKAAP